MLRSRLHYIASYLTLENSRETFIGNLFIRPASIIAGEMSREFPAMRNRD